MAKVELKQPIVDEIKSSIEGAQSVVAVKYLGINVDQDTKLRKELREEVGDTFSPEKFDEIVEKRVKREIEKGVQILQYQINTLNTSNG